MSKKRMYKRSLWIIFLLGVVSSCSQTSISDKPEVLSAETDKEVQWEDLRIQKLLPGYMIFPAIEPCLPAHFVGLRHPKNQSKVYWGDKDVLEAYFEKGISDLKSAIISVDISLEVAQIDENRFSGEDFDFESMGIKNCIRNKWNWGIHPVMSMSTIMEDTQIDVAWIGLDHQGQVLCAALIYPRDLHVPSQEDLNMWSDFLHKTRFLDEHEFFKAHGQDLRKGLTLVNVYGSVLKVFAEKRKRDGKIQVSIKPGDEHISCKCLNAAEMLMGGDLHFAELLLKIPSEIQVCSDANIVSHEVISVLMKEVAEFSAVAEGSVRSEYENVSIFNFCKEEILKKG